MIRFKNTTFLSYDFLEDTKDQNSQDYLSQYGTNFTELSKRGLLEQCFSRENDLYKIMEILLRKQKNNPVLVGEPGVGKTALVELFADRIANHDIPFVFEECHIIGIDIGKMIAGAKYRGEFEQRLNELLEQILEENDAIVFFDEIHMLKASGTTEGALDPGNLLKPILSRPGFRCLGATTPKEYKKIEEDAALTRRFHAIPISESSKADTFEILAGIRTNLEVYHNVHYTDFALIEAINLSSKYIGDKVLPDKAIDLLDRAGAREVLYRADMNYASMFHAILFSGLKKLSALKMKAFRRGDIATQFILSEIENAYQNVKLRWSTPPESEKNKNETTKIAKKENYFQKFDTTTVEDDFDILTVEILPTADSSTAKHWIKGDENELVFYESSFPSISMNSFLFPKKLEMDQRKMEIRKKIQKKIIEQEKVVEQALFAISFPFLKTEDATNDNLPLFFDFYQPKLQNLSLKKEKQKKSYAFFKQKLVNILISYRDSFSDFDTRSYHFEEYYPEENSPKEHSSNDLSFLEYSPHEHYIIEHSSDQKYDSVYKPASVFTASTKLDRLERPRIKRNALFDPQRNILTKIKKYQTCFEFLQNVSMSVEKKIHSVALDSFLEVQNEKKNLFLKLSKLRTSEIRLDEANKEISVQKYSSPDSNTLRLINNSILQRVDDLLFFSNKPKFLLDTKEKKKNLSRQKNTENYKLLITEFFNGDEKKGTAFEKLKKNTFNITLTNGSSVFSLYRAGLLFLYKEKCELQNLVIPFDNFLQRFYLIQWNPFYNYFSKYLYNYTKNLKQFNRLFFLDVKNTSKIEANKDYFINDIVLDFLEEDTEQLVSLHQTLDKNNEAKINGLTTLFKSLPPLLHKRYIDILTNDLVEKQEDVEVNNSEKSTSLLTKKEENELVYNLLGFFYTQKGRNFLANTDDPELIRIARKLGDTNLAALESRIGAYEIQRLVTSVTGIPVESLTESEMQRLLNLENILHKRVVGQNEAITALSKAIRRSRLGIQNPSRPIGSFLFCGPTGVGKTELSKALSEAIFGSEKEMIRFDMSEFMERFSVTRLIGSPPGYVGYEEGGQLSDSVRKKPYSLVLFDEIEKAHVEVLNILLQVLEDGRLTDSQKRLVLFQNTIIIMTSNAAAKEIQLSLESIEKERKKKNEEKNEAIIDTSLSTEIVRSQKNISKRSYVDSRLGRVDLIPSAINTNFIVDIRDNIKQTFSGSYTSQLFVNKLYNQFPELNDFTIHKEKNQSIILSKQKSLSLNKKKERNQQEMNEGEIIKGLQKNFVQKNIDQADIKELVMNKLTKFFLPEFINRLDDIIVFESLTYEDILEIYDVMVEKLIKRVKENKINLFIDPSVKGKLVNEGYSKTFGARPLRRLVTKYLEDTLSTTLLTSRNINISKQECTIRISLNEDDIITGQLIV